MKVLQCSEIRYDALSIHAQDASNGSFLSPIGSVTHYRNAMRALPWNRMI
ncbi:MAG: hypothetical protein RLZZ422_1034 [Pseudomonadota bacterium]|jgi:hypothetical protein